ncbi:MAG: protein translocase subunit SecD [Gracilimonas sp.]|uniref:protein translocase subunit SecD n=1 Tax=Gracilimonas TaxID=649462 RepID=UPI001B2614A7|nr:protein translocase subunit SecD [Gracilimonas sp.]MBO6585741.1 protein translocase subunit SecD [Gracilimonas sp.]MBO6616738.1 protein translocase subunit SecD [Gracilimonas sp.]
MQGNGFKIGCIVAFLALTIYYLYPTVVWSLEQNYMEELSPSERAQYQEENQQKLEDLRTNTLSLGLDLQGGMHVTLEVGVPQLIRELAGENADQLLNDVIDVAAERSLENDTDFIDEMVAEFESRDPDARLSRYYRNDAMDITRRSTNEEIATFLKTQRQSALDRAIEIIRTRVDRYGVTEPSIVKQGNNRIVVELPGVEDKERVRSLLKGTARLEFRLAADAQEFRGFVNSVYEYYDDYTASADTADSAASNQFNPLEEVLVPAQSPYLVGYATPEDTARVMDLLTTDDIQRMMPRSTTMMWSANPLEGQGGSDLYQLIGVRTQVELTGDVIEAASVQFDPATNVPEVSMTMNSEGARKWGRITGANIGKPVAIVLDGFVFSYPNVNTKISNGRSSITGLDGVDEAEDLVNILLSGALPAPLEILEERTVGATLGAESIQAGLNSILFGLGIVAIFMIIYYRTGGGIADLALLLNIIFILGILAAFKATLTLPGIAGIVLTIGMAVDANVLIFDRIREEQRTGKTLKASIEAGYANAMSAIVDANVTTFFVAIILFSFGVGPIKGFAVTLMAGIVASLFSAIVITRVVVDYLTQAKKSAVSFG